ncbi:MAG: cobyric acid synthase [Lautropia sp.]|nr:cobyric acid synthase [Lautropia sp.]
MDQRLAHCVMVLGTTSGAGKSWIATALCRWYARQGLRVAPFKAQNMSNNARVVAGGEIGSAQYFQALAAGVEPTVQMNPLLLKPEADTRSQVILLGQVSAELTALPWRARHQHTWPIIARTLDALRRQYDVIVIEGAGSPAEINLQSTDVVNMRVARHVGAACLLVSDIDRGGAFAHLYGTWALMPPEDRQLLKGFVLNRFRGDASLLAPAPQMLEEMTGVPVVATVPMWTGHGLPEEDGWFQYRDRLGDDDHAPAVDVLSGHSAPHAASHQTEKAAAIWHDDEAAGASMTSPRLSTDRVTRSTQAETGAGGKALSARSARQIALIAPPRISNLDEFQPLASVPGVRLVMVRDGASLPALSTDDWIILPGSKHTSSDLAWLKRERLDDWVRAHTALGGAVLGICGGLQMLGERLEDPYGVEGSASGLGLLSLATVFEPEKVLRRRRLAFDALPAGPWSALSGLEVSGYEIHQGRTSVQSFSPPIRSRDIGLSAPLLDVGHDAHSPDARSQSVLPDALGWCNAAGNVLGIYLHGLFENDQVLSRLFGVKGRPWADVFDGLADHLGASFEPGVLASLIKG